MCVCVCVCVCMCVCACVCVLGGGAGEGGSKRENTEKEEGGGLEFGHLSEIRVWRGCQPIKGRPESFNFYRGPPNLKGESTF